jgi:aspartyl-tRNA(Asn)/glutamyl-tRNA(Gln) amidotransferase subunit A
MSDVQDLDLTGAAAAIRAGKVSSLELTKACLDRLDWAQPQLNCALRIDHEEALESARRADVAIARGAPVGPVHGVPLAHKDLFYRNGKVSTCGSKIRRMFTPDCTATVLRRLDEAGAVDVGTLNMSELAYSPTGHNVHFGDCRNPWSARHIAGGSSSGAGAAVAARLIFGALGTDTAGSVRLPAAVCGVVGLKPTAGLVSRSGVMPVSFSLDAVGPLTRTVRDCALLTGVIAGADPEDPTTWHARAVRLDEDLQRPVTKLRVGIPTTYFTEGMTADVSRLFAGAADVFRSIGAEIVEVSPPALADTASLANIVLACEAAAIHSNWFHERPQDYSDLVRARVELGFHHPATRYLDALKLRAQHLDVFGASVLDRVDVMLAPLMPIPVPTLEETDVGGSPVMQATIAALTRCGRPINYLGLPSLALPAGFTDNGLPFGIQIVGRPFAEGLLFRVGHGYERETAWHTRRPPGF